MLKKSLLFLVFVLCLSRLADAGTYNWTNSVSPGAWSDPLNWDNGVPADNYSNTIFIHKGIINFSSGDSGKGNLYIIGGKDGETAVANHSGGIFEQNSNSSLCVGTDGGTGTLNLYGNGSISTTSNGSVTIGLLGGIGTFNLSENGQLTMNGIGGMTIGSNNGTGFANVSGGTLKIRAMNLGMFDGTGTFDQSGGKVICDYTGVVNGTFNLSGGTHEIVCDMAVSSQGTSGTPILNLTGGSLTFTDTRFGVLQIGFDGKGIFNQSGGTLTVKDIIVGGGNTKRDGTINISGGQINADILKGDRGSRMNIYGSNADIQIKDIQAAGVAGTFDITFVLDHEGASTINALTVGKTGMRLAPFQVKIPGFVSLKVAEIDLFHATSGYGVTSVQDKTPFKFTNGFVDSGKTLRLTMANTIPTWDFTDAYDVPAASNGQKLGAVKLLGTPGGNVPLEAHFIGLNETLAPLLVDYLNNAVMGIDTGVKFKLLDNDTLVLTGDYLNDDGYAWFGWDLSGFNSGSVSLVQLNRHLNPFEEGGGVPEPATWACCFSAVADWWRCGGNR